MTKDSRKKFSLQVHHYGYQVVMPSVVIIYNLNHRRIISLLHKQGGNFKMRRRYKNPALSYCGVVILLTSWT